MARKVTDNSWTIHHSQKYGKKRRIRESGKLGNLLCITDPRNQDLRFNEKPPKRQQWGKLAFRETYNLFVPKKHSLLSPINIKIVFYW